MEFVENSIMERNIMQRISILFQFEGKCILRTVASVLFALFLGCSFEPTFAQQPGQRTFASAEDAGNAFLAAMQAPDDQAPLTILGPAGKDVFSSGDPAEDADARETFIVKYQEMHRFVTESNGKVALVVGAENWPFPIPLANNHGSWYFDTAAGKDEIVFRRVGKNELSAIDACRELVEAQQQYFARPPQDIPKQFAQRFVSDEGRFNGYFFRILTSQGSHAPGGAKNYVVEGKMSAGFAFVAYPAEYRSSGVMTFIVDGSGTIYEKDLGPDTAKLAEAMTAYDPDPTWHKAE
jgi:hypothetical protein